MEASLVGWGLYSLWRASRRSPFVFTEEDAHLVCQTPVSRPGATRSSAPVVRQRPSMAPT